MSLDVGSAPQPSGGTASSPPPASAPSSTPEKPVTALGGGTPPAATPPPAAKAADPAPAAPAQRGLGDNGGPDWRAMLAGEDATVAEQLSRYATPADFVKAHTELRTKLSQRPEAPRLDDNATPEQIAAYRRANEVPEVSQDAKDLAYVDAYGLKVPETTGEVEKAMLGRFAKQMNARHVPKRAVQAAVNEFFGMQEGLRKQADEIAVTKRREWQGALRDELGSREYEMQLSAANKWLKGEFRDNPDELSNLMGAQLPGGGYLGDHPWFAKLAMQLALANGHGDEIVASTMESGGKSLAQIQQELEGLRRTNRSAYDAPGTQTRLKEVIALRVKRGEIDEFGNEVRRRA